MSKFHLGRHELDRLEAGQLSQAETTEISRHLIHCSRCRGVLDAVRSEAAELLKELLHDLARDGSLSDRLSFDAVAVGKALYEASTMQENGTVTPLPSIEPAEVAAELAQLEPADRRAALARYSDGPLGEVAEQLLQRSWNARTEDPLVSARLAHAALEVLERIDGDFEGEPQLEDLRARAWCYLGNSRRIRHLMEDARQAFERAEEHLNRGTRDPRERAVLLSSKGVYLSELRRFEEADRLFDQAVAIHQWAGNHDGELMGRISKANNLEASGDPDAALRVLQEASGLVREGADPFLVMCIQQNLALNLLQTGQAEKARKFLPKLHEFVQRQDMKAQKPRVLWLEGRVAYELGQTDTAEAIFQEVRQQFRSEGFGYETALVSLDLAVLLLEGDRTEETRELAQEMLQMFNALDIQREAFAALILFQRAAVKDQATVQMARDIATFIERASTNPALQFEEPS